MNENIKKFYEALAKDNALKAKLDALSGEKNTLSREGFVAFANESGFAFSLEEFNAYVSELKDDDLDKVAGGADWPCNIPFGRR